jgi:hypothetical protein
MGARFYDPYINRWISADTIVPEMGNPQAWNRYSYTYNNPCRYTDPTGHICIPCILVPVAVVAIAAWGAGECEAPTVNPNSGTYSTSLLKGVFASALAAEEISQDRAQALGLLTEGAVGVVGALAEPTPFGEVALIAAGLGFEGLSAAIGSDRKVDAVQMLLAHAYTNAQYEKAEGGVLMSFHLFSEATGGDLSEPVTSGYFGITLQDAKGNVLVNVNSFNAALVDQYGEDLKINALIFEKILAWAEENRQWLFGWQDDYYTRHAHQNAGD